MIQAFTWLATKIHQVLTNEQAADAIEYLLTIAVVCVAVVLGVATGLPAAWLANIIDGVCNAIDTTFPSMGLTC